jgi:hypothetical protein
MRYHLNLSDRAIADLGDVPLSLLDEAERALARLAESPVGESVRSALPHPLNRQLFHFTATDFAGKRWFFTTHFRYGQDEATLYVMRVTAQPPN